MNTIKTFIPSESVDAFKKFAEKTKRNVEGFDYTISNPRKKVIPSCGSRRLSNHHW